MACAGVGADAGEDFLIVSVDQMQPALGVELYQFKDVCRVDAAVVALRLPGGAGVVAKLFCLNPDLGFGE